MLYLAFVPAMMSAASKSGGVVHWFPIAHLPAPLAFDHDRLVRELLAVDALRYRAISVDAISRKVSASGAISYEDGRYYVGRKLAGQRVQLTVFPDCLLVDHVSGFHKELNLHE